MKNLKYAVAAIALLPSVAWAQDTGEHDIVIADSLMTPEKEIVVTANGNRTQRKETGQAISVIDAETLQASQTASISDILRTVPSIAIARNGGVGSQTSIFIRGGESSQTLVLIDGVRINDPSSPNAAFDFGALLTGNIDRVEVLRGPNSVIWGSQAIGGVVSVRTAEPTEQFLVNALAEYGSNNTAQARANIAGTSGMFSGSVGAGYYRTDGISALSAGTEKDGYRNFAANGKLKVSFSDAFTLDLRGYYNKGRVEFDDPFGASVDTFPVTDNAQFIGYVGMNSSLFDDRLKSRLSYSRTDISRIGTEPNVPFSFNVNRLKGAIDRFEYHGTFDAVEAATLNFGVEHERSFASTFFPAGGGTTPDSARNTVTSGFGQLTLRPFTGLTLTGGVRYDDYSIYGGQTTFGANFAYTPNDGNTVIRGTYAQGFRAPTLTEALLPFGNTALKPETAKSYDVGVEHSFLDGRATVSATYFRRNSNDTITFSFVSFQSENIARTRAEGIELGLSLRPSSTMTIGAHYSLVDATSRSPDTSFGKQLARRPKDSASFVIDWKSPWGLALGSTLTLTGDSFNNLANTVRLDGFALASLRASYPVTERFELYGRVENLFDAKYETVRGYGTLGRNAYIGVRAKF
jgi:vitamin B12 transporter